MAAVVWEDKAYQAKQAKQAAREKRQAKHKQLSDWKTNTMQAGSDEQVASVERFQDRIFKCKANFATYATDMAKWQALDDAQKEANDLNLRYHRAMANYCLSPLTDGVSETSVLDCVGIYIGMCMISPDFRHQVNKDVAAALLPVAERAAKCNCSVKNWAEELRANVTGSDVQKVHTIDESHSVRFLRGVYEKADRQGRVPFTPESAATQQLSFVTSAYQAMRVPGADVAKIQEQFAQASTVLQKLAERDGISEDQLNQNVRNIAGQMMDRYPEYRRVFAETAYGDVQKDRGEQMTSPSGERVEVWRGQFQDQNGEPYRGTFTPRAPVDFTGYNQYIKSYLFEQFDHCETLESVKKRAASPVMKRTLGEFHDMMEDDIPAFCKTYEEALQKTEEGMANAVMSKMCNEYGQEWGKTHGPTKEEQEAYRRQQDRTRDVSDMIIFDPSVYQSGAGFEL